MTPVETIKSLLFSLSLAGDAEQWLRITPLEFLATWNDIERAFLNAFFPQHLAWKIKTSIINFRQGKVDTFDFAWKRFYGYLRDFPHHALKKGSILSMFYRGYDPDHQELLDSSSGGSFSDLSVEGGEILFRKVVKNARNNWKLRDPEQREVFFCGSGNPNDNWLSQMLRDMNQEDARRDAIKQQENLSRSTSVKLNSTQKK